MAYQETAPGEYCIFEGMSRRESLIRCINLNEESMRGREISHPSYYISGDRDRDLAHLKALRETLDSMGEEE